MMSVTAPQDGLAEILLTMLKDVEGLEVNQVFLLKSGELETIPAALPALQHPSGRGADCTGVKGQMKKKVVARDY